MAHEKPWLENQLAFVGENMTGTVEELFAVTEIELIYRNPKKPKDRPRITDSRKAFDLFQQTWDQNKIELVEQFKIMLLDRNNSCIGLSNIASGGMASCVVDPKIVFATALKAKAMGIILAHNHPSGNLKPSDSDGQLTEKLCLAGKLLEIRVLDHLIVGTECYLSLADEGLMPT
jgi:DNA repair protein RadC